MTKVTKMEDITGRPFNFRMPREVIFEAGVSKLAARKAAALGAKRPVFITGRSIAKSKALARLMDDPYFDREPPKSTGREHFNTEWLEARLKNEEPVEEAAPAAQ